MKKDIKVHTQRVIKYVNALSAQMEQDIDKAITEDVMKYEELDQTIVEEMFRLTEATREVEAFQQQGRLGSLDLQPYKQLVQQIQTPRKIPEITLKLGLSDITNLSQSTIIGELNGKVEVIMFIIKTASIIAGFSTIRRCYSPP